MRTEQELKRALSLLGAYRTDFRRKTPSLETQQNLTGCEAAIEWMLGDDSGPLANTLADLPTILAAN